MEVPVCNGTISAPGGVLTCTGAWESAAAAKLTLQDGELIAGAVLFVLALAFAFRAARRSFFKGEI